MTRTRVFIHPDPWSGEKWSRAGNQHSLILAKGLRAGFGQDVVTGIGAAELVDAPSGLAGGVLLLHWPDELIQTLQARAAATWRPRLSLERESRRRSRLAIQAAADLLDRLTAQQTRILHFVHDLDAHGAASQPDVDSAVRTLLAHRADGLITTEASCWPAIDQAFPGATQQRFLSPLGSYADVHGPELDRTHARRQLGLDEDATVVLLFGTPRADRQATELASAVAALPRLTLVVAGPSLFGVEYDRSVQAPNVRYLDGFLSDPTVAALFSAADFVVNPTPGALNSGAIRTAVAYGRPVVARPFGATSDLCHDCLMPLTNDIRAVLGSLPDPAGPHYASLQEAARRRNAERPWSKAVEGVVKAVTAVAPGHGQVGIAP